MPPRPGIYGEIRYLREAIKADENHLQNAPIGARKRKQLEDEIATQRARLMQLNQELREWQNLKKRK